MKQTTWNGKEVLLVELPEGAYCIDVKRIYGKWKLQYFFNGDNFNCIVLPGKWQFAFADPLSPTEEEAGEWVEKFMIAPHGVDGWPPVKAYKTYGAICQPVANPVTSLYSRIRSEGFQYPERVVVLRKIK